MTEQKMKMVRCKACGAPFGAVYYESVNTKSPELVQAIISGKMFEIRCPKCGHTENVMFPLLFNDMKHGYMIWLTTEESLTEIVKVLCDMPAPVKKRIVLEPEDLREKAAVLDAGLDDRAGELYKLLMLLALREDGKLRMEDVEKTLLISEGDGKFFLVIRFYDGRSSGMQTTAEMIAAATESFPFRDDREREDFVVNANWAVKYFKEEMGI